MEKETRLDDESSGKDKDESTSMLENAESKKTKKKASIEMNDKSDEDNEEGSIEMRKDHDKEETKLVEPSDNDDLFSYYDWIRQNIRTKVKVQDVIDEVETNSFGSIVFKGVLSRPFANFVQMSDDTPTDIIFNLLEEKWRLAQPRILISIIGGAKLFKMKDDLKELLSDGLRKIAISRSTWVITEGTNTGTSKFVGKSLQDVTRSLIGISTWGAIANTESLYGNDGKMVGYEVVSSLTDKRTFLDHNHPFHLLVDDTSREECGKEIPLVSRMLKYAAYKKDQKAPSIMLLLEVGVNSLENVINAVAGEQPIPVLVVNGLGLTEHVLSYAMQCYDEIHLSGKRKHEGLVNFITKNIDLHEHSNIFYMNVLKCLEHRHMISVVALNKEEGIDVKILKAISKYYDITSEERLHYTVTILGNRVNTAENLFLDTSITFEKKSLEDAIVMALALNRYELVEYLVDHNISIHELVTKPLLEFLYGCRSLEEESIVDSLVATSPQRGVHRHFFSLLNEHELKTDVLAIISYENILNLLSSLCKKMKIDMPQEYELDDSRTEYYDELSWYSAYPYRDLFLWAVVNNMQNMAKVLWKLGEEPMAKAIVAAEINRKLAKKAVVKNVVSKETIQMLKKNEMEFRELALNVLDSVNRQKHFLAEVMVTAELFQFHSQSCVTLANDSCFQEFIAHKAVQRVLKNLWCGKLRYEDHLIKLTRKWDLSICKDYKPLTSKKRTYKKSSSIDSDSDIQNRHSITKVLSYRFDVPERKFIASLVSYCIFLMLISYCAVLKKEDTTPNVIEIIVFVWVISYAVEELYQIYVTRHPTTKYKFQIHFKDFFNLVDVTAIILHFIAFALQLNSPSMEYGHLLYAIDAMLWIVRLLQYFYASKILGIYVIMIGRMFIDMCYFISILVVFLFAYGVLSTSILRPENRIFNMIKNIVYFPYFNIYGELFADNDSSPGMTKFGTKVMNDYAEPISWIFLGLFLLISNVLLLNLLIAIFGNTFSKVQEKADQFWRFKRYALVTEYALKLSLPPPFTVFACVWKLISRSDDADSLCSEEDLSTHIHFSKSYETQAVLDILRVQKTELQQKDAINKKP